MPRGVTVFVAIAAKHCVKKFTLEGEFIASVVQCSLIHHGLLPTTAPTTECMCVTMFQ